MLFNFKPGLFSVFISVVICFASCFTNDTGTDAKGITDAVYQELASDVTKAKNIYDSLNHDALINEVRDSLTAIHLQSLEKKVLKTHNYIDSLHKIIASFESEGDNSIDKIRSALAEGPPGDSLHRYLADVFSTTNLIVIEAKQKIIVDSLTYNVMQSMVPGQNWQQELFSLASSQSARFILYSLQAEVFKIALETLRGL